ncbi:MAG: putative neutral zinc metallopeptidase [Cyanobacteriota bacterium]|jgi:hypothetical protein
MQHSMVLRGGALTQLLCALCPQPLAVAQSSPPVDAVAIDAIARSLTGIWLAQPSLQPRQPPALEFLRRGLSVKAACPQSSDQVLPAAYCPTSHRLLIDPDRMDDTRDHFRLGGLVFWIARGYGQALVMANPSSRPPSRLQNLQATCLAGTLLGLMPSTPQQPLQTTLNQALRATLADFDPEQTPSEGKASQRAYAFLTGTGATRLSCSSAALSPLAAEDPQVPDREILLLFSDQLRGPSVGFDQFCRRPPQPTCPRPLAWGPATSGI